MPMLSGVPCGLPSWLPVLHTLPPLNLEEERLPYLLNRQLAASRNLSISGEYPSKCIYFGSCQQKPDFIKRILGLFASLLLWELLTAPMHICHFSAKSNIYVISRQRTFEALVMYHSSFCSTAQAGQLAQPFVTTFPSPTSQVQGIPFAKAGKGGKHQDEKLNKCGRNFPVWVSWNLGSRRHLETLKRHRTLALREKKNLKPLI